MAKRRPLCWRRGTLTANDHGTPNVGHTFKISSGRCMYLGSKGFRVTVLVSIRKTVITPVGSFTTLPYTILYQNMARIVALALAALALPARGGSQPKRLVCETTVQSGDGILEIELWPTVAPHGVQRAVELVEDGFFNDLPFFRAIQGFLIQFGISVRARKDLGTPPPCANKLGGFMRSSCAVGHRVFGSPLLRCSASGIREATSRTTHTLRRPSRSPMALSASQDTDETAAPHTSSSHLARNLVLAKAPGRCGPVARHSRHVRARRVRQPLGPRVSGASGSCDQGP